MNPPENGTIIGDDGLARPPWASVDPLMREYYDHEWGMPVRDERGLYERISLEGFQAGLSWATILRKRDGFRSAFLDFHPESVAAFTEADVELSSGDLFVFGGASRFAYHGVTKVLPGTAPEGCGLPRGRINITMRATGMS